MAFTGQLGTAASMLANIELGVGAGVVAPPPPPPPPPPPVVVPPVVAGERPGAVYIPLPELVSVGVAEIRPTRTPRGRGIVPLD